VFERIPFLNGDLLVLCKAADVEEESPLRVEVEGKAPLAVFNLAGQYFVTDDTCTHGEASLADGFIEGEEIECPWHAGRFCIRTGKATAFPAVTPLKVYKTRLVDGYVAIDVSMKGSQ